ncbi:unnamed protein product [Anisakis simplex]|uniref:CC domain-containing protein n=1 Tax=Anisakis simplex TaxID=6269 RepID=A0A0M3JH20_ANISI|nr:unnamed protein product [Anisakis simplex]
MPRLSICCPQVPQLPTIPTPTIPNTCPVGGAPVGNCINGMCPTGFVCNPMSNQCCPTSGSTGSAGAISTAPNPFGIIFATFREKIE